MAASSAAVVIKEAACSVAHRPLPPVPPDAVGKTSLVLFYQYVEPQWTGKEHKHALKTVIALGERCGVKGRGRCAAEGLNCTLTGPPEAIRAFCSGLRAWKPALFDATDFKITDGLEAGHGFKALTIQKKDDLVAYGLPSELTPALQTSKARHVEADEYHELMGKPDTVIIDVRNAYESAIGHFQPPAGGATLIDPKMRNSQDFPSWINAPETQAKLHGKQVLMYCTGGIRCERASALLDAMARSSDGKFEVKDTVMVRGGIERYMKTFPQGGFWKGKNYLFDRRLEQVPESKTGAALDADVESHCCVCRAPYGYYRGQYVCAGVLASSAAPCKVPVIVCQSCALGAPEPSTLRCPLCEEGYEPPAVMPELLPLRTAMAAEAPTPEGQAVEAAARREAEAAVAAARAVETAAQGRARPGSKRARQEAHASQAPPSTHLCIRNLPLLVSATELRCALLAVLRGQSAPPHEPKAAKRWRRVQALKARGHSCSRPGCHACDPAAAAATALVITPPSPKREWGDDAIGAIRWGTDRATGLFYGTAFVEVSEVSAASTLVAAADLREVHAEAGRTTVAGGVSLRGRRLRVHYAPHEPMWSPAGGQRERP